jgi:hypothetical protein
MRIETNDLLIELLSFGRKKKDIKPLSLEDQTRRIGERAELVKTMILEEISWRQKSRTLWL